MSEMESRTLKDSVLEDVYECVHGDYAGANYTKKKARKSKTRKANKAARKARSRNR